jgi:hypothetical protein
MPETPPNSAPGTAETPGEAGASDDPQELARELALLRSEIARLNAHRFVQIHNTPLKLLGFQFARGLALGLGTVVGASALVSVLVYFLAQIEVIPVVGKWAADIAREIEASQP